MLSTILSRLINAYEWMIIAWALLSWFPTTNQTMADIRGALGYIVEPYINLFRRIIPPLGMIDISPIIALLVLQVIERVL